MIRTLRRTDTPAAPKASPDSMTLLEHLGELRRRLIICIVAFFAGGVVCYGIYNHILSFLRSPYCKAFAHGRCPNFVITALLQGFSARLDTCALGGFILALPVILWELWAFVTPGMKANEKRYALPFVVSTVLLFVAGALAAYEMFPRGIGFLVRSSGTHVNPLLTIQSYISIISLLMLVFGLAFEFPVVLVALEIAGVITPRALRRFRRFAILIIVILAAVVTPSPDPFSMFALAAPLYIFYEGSILVGQLLGK